MHIPAVKKRVNPILPKYLEKNATKDSLLAANMYTREGPALYRVLNGALRAEHKATLERVQVLFSNLLLALQSLPGNETAGELYRGQDKIYGKDVTIGAHVIWEGFTSVSSEQAVAQNFAGGGGVLFVLHAVPETIGGCLKDLSDFPNEAEILLPPGASFSVIKDRQDVDCRVLELQYVGVLPSTLAAGMAFTTSLQKVPDAMALCGSCAWPALVSSLRPYTNGRAAIDLIRLQPEVLSPRINQQVEGMRGAPLWVAARNHDSVELLEGLVDLGADLQGSDTSGSTALHMAAFYGHAKCVKYLLEADSKRAGTVQMRDKHNHTAMDMGQRYPEVVAVFAEYGIERSASPERIPSPERASRCSTAESSITAREVCGLIGLTPTPRSYDAALYGHKSPNRSRPTTAATDM